MSRKCSLPCYKWEQSPWQLQPGLLDTRAVSLPALSLIGQVNIQQCSLQLSSRWTSCDGCYCWQPKEPVHCNCSQECFKGIWRCRGAAIHRYIKYLWKWSAAAQWHSHSTVPFEASLSYLAPLNGNTLCMVMYWRGLMHYLLTWVDSGEETHCWNA